MWSDVVRWARLIARFTQENGVRRDMVRGYYEFLKIKSSDLSSIRNWGICSGTYFLLHCLFLLSDMRACYMSEL